LKNCSRLKIAWSPSLRALMVLRMHCETGGVLVAQRSGVVQ
jgi:hypothetical protein